MAKGSNVKIIFSLSPAVAKALRRAEGREVGK
jgi:hypothetical protein